MAKINNFFLYSSFCSLLLIIILCSTGCSEEQPPLSQANKIKADSIFRDQELIVQAEVDSLCKLIYAARFDAAAVDSIAEVRLKEIESYTPN